MSVSSKVSRIFLIADAVSRLGVKNVTRIAAYRLGMLTGYWRRTMPIKPLAPAPLFGRPLQRRAPVAADTGEVIARAEALRRGEVTLFSKHVVQGSAPPDWHANPMKRTRVMSTDRHWSTIPDFDASVGDIKCVWELSRWSFAQTFAAAECVAGDGRSLDTLEAWCADWQRANPLNQGPNWKCAQEASLRVLSLVVAADLLGGLTTPTPGLTRLLKEHAARIEPTMLYAIAQDNNHGTSEAIGLYVIGAVLTRSTIDEERQDGARLVRAGLDRLVERCERLILADGTFSQYSVVYQRLMLDTAIVGEIVRRSVGLPPWPEPLRARLAAASDWLAAMTDAATGDAPNIGANDGAMLFAIGGATFRDFRPTVQLASVLFAGQRRFPPGAWDHLARWLGVEPLDALLVAAERVVRHAPFGGFTVVNAGAMRVVLRGPVFRFRPSQPDAMHVDVWHSGVNVLCDAGTFAYSASASEARRFSGPEGHNAVSFDDEAQMPSVSRFLYAHWLSGASVVEVANGGAVRWSASYRDWKGRRHARVVEISEHTVQVFDHLSGTFNKATIRWRSGAGGVVTSSTSERGAHATTATLRIAVESDKGSIASETEQRARSLYYLDQEPVQALVVHVGSDISMVSTCITLDSNASVTGVVRGK